MALVQIGFEQSRGGQMDHDGYFGLIKYRYRRSDVYTYHQLADLIEASSEHGHNLCQRYLDQQGNPNFTYRDFRHWLLKYFKKLPNITKYHHFHFDHRKPGMVPVKKTIDGASREFNLLKKEFCFPLTFRYHHFQKTSSQKVYLQKGLGISMSKFVGIFH